jgi:hypothetical protein
MGAFSWQLGMGVSKRLRWRLTVGLTAAVAASFIAGCCGGPFSADGRECGACDCDNRPDAANPDGGDAAAG